jgi:tetratricopeptide (TPR) repeat protein
MKKTKKKHKLSKTSGKGRKRNVAPLNGRQKRNGLISIYFNKYAIVYEPMDDEYTKLVPPEIDNEINNELYYLTRENPKKAIDRLNQLKRQYPDYPRIYNYLANAYSFLGDSEKLIKVVEENYRKNPEYLFAKVNYAEICLHGGEIDKIPIIFDHKFDLKMLYPYRNEFHVTEAISFFGLLGRYYLKIGDLGQSRRMLKILEDIDPDNENTQLLKSIINQKISRLKP